jgi:HAD superfamily hydrolase (TIGR01509 family)
VLRGVLFDIDGTLLDSNDAHARAWVEALHEAGHDVPFARVRRLIGMGADKLLPELGLEAEDRTGRAVAARRGALFRERHLPTVAPLPGARALVERLRAGGFRLGVATSAPPEEAALLLERAGVAGLLASRAAGGAADSKPDPDIVQAALRAIGLPGSEAVLIGDTPYDVAAAARAGVVAIAFRSGGWDDEALAGALAVYDGPADLLSRLDGSPLRARAMA